MPTKSNLTSYVKISPSSNNPRKSKVCKITPHHMAGNLTLEQFGNIVSKTARQMSSNYAIDSKGNIGCFVYEENRSWCSSSPSNDHMAITIEVANDSGAPNWHVSDVALESLVALCVDICRRYDFLLNYTGNANGNFTMHQFFTSTACPGPYLKSKFPYIAEEVNKRLKNENISNNGNGVDEIMPMSTQPVKMWLGPMSGGDAQKVRSDLENRKIPFVEKNNILTTSIAVSAGDQTPILKLVVSLGGIGYGPVLEETTTGVSQEQHNSVIAERNALQGKVSQIKAIVG